MSYFAETAARHLLTITLACLLTGGCTAAEQELTPFEQAVDAIGGEKALTGLELLRIEASGNIRVDYESPRPSEPEDVSSYTTSHMFDIRNDDLRTDTVRTPLFEALQFFPPASFSIVLNGNVGGLTAQAGFSPPGNVPSQYVGAMRTQQRLFNPHFYLREGLADPALIGDGGAAEFEGHSHRVIRFAGTGGEVRLFVDDESGSISKLETLRNHVLVRDVLTEVRYLNWQSHGSLAFPSAVELYAGGALVQDEARLAVTIGSSFPAGTFALPPEAVDPTLDAEALAFGQQTHQVLDAFFNLGFFIQEAPPVVTSEVAPGVTLLGGGGAASSLAVAYDQGLVVFEAPASPKHGSNLVATLDRAFPGLAITHLVQSHYHQDHAAGVRSFAAAGATAVVGNGVSGFWDGVLSATSTIRPDALAGAGVVPKVEEIPLDGTFVIKDANITITAHHVSANPHSDDMVIAVIETEGEVFVFEADLYNAGFGLTLVLGGPEALFASLRDLGVIDASCRSPVPLTIIPAHGTPLSLAESLAELAGQSINVGCP